MFIFTLLLTVAAQATATFTECELALIHSEFARTPEGSSGLISKNLPLTPDTVREAYARGIFPWGEAENGMSTWNSPALRGVLFFKDLHIGRSDRKAIRRLLESGEYQVTFDQAFTEVMTKSMEMERLVRNAKTGEVENEGTWISPKLVEVYEELHRQGIAHSVEVWHEDQLVAGLYGTFVNGVYSGDSMFHERGAHDIGKLAFHMLIERLQNQGHTFIDVQTAGDDNPTSLTTKWGAVQIPRERYLEIMKEAQSNARPY